MRKPIIAGNWKMNKNPKETQAFVEAVVGKLPSGERVESAIAAPALSNFIRICERIRIKSSC